MLRFILPIILFVGCSDYKSTNEKSEEQDRPETLKPKSISNEHKQIRPALFDNRKPYQVQLIGRRIETNTTDKDTAKCARWILTSNQIATILKHSELIDGTTWDLAFDFLSCSLQGTIIQNNIQYPFTINAGSFTLVNSGDTTVIYGDFHTNDKKYFLSSPQQ